MQALADEKARTGSRNPKYARLLAAAAGDEALAERYQRSRPVLAASYAQQAATIRRTVNENILLVRLNQIDTGPAADYLRVHRLVERLRELNRPRPTISEMYFDTLRRPGFADATVPPPPRRIIQF